jgi:hypothetical protein
MELLVSCSDDEYYTSLKWDRSSHPVAPECCVSHTLRLKYIEGNSEELFGSSAVYSRDNLPDKQGVLLDIQDLKVLTNVVNS